MSDNFKKAQGWLGDLEKSRPAAQVVKDPALSCISCGISQAECTVFVELELPGYSVAAKQAGVSPRPFKTGLCSKCWPSEKTNATK